MTVTRDEVLRVARLAELQVDDAQVAALAEDLSRIVDYVAQLAQLAVGDVVKPYRVGPDAAPLRPDEVKPWPLAFGPAELAPVFKSGFFAVPRLGQFDGPEADA